MTRGLRSVIGIAGAAVVAAGIVPASAQSTRLEYRVVHAAPRELQRRVDEAGRDGYTCAAVARREPDVRLNGVVVILSRPYMATTQVSIVVPMARLPLSPTVRPEFDVDTIDPDRLNGLSGVYLGDVPYLSSGQRVVITIHGRSSTSYVVQDRLPFMGTLDDADINAMRPLGEHLARNRERLTFASVRRGDGGSPMLHTVFTRFSQ